MAHGRLFPFQDFAAFLLECLQKYHRDKGVSSTEGLYLRRQGWSNAKGATFCNLTMLPGVQEIVASLIILGGQFKISLQPHSSPQCLGVLASKGARRFGRLVSHRWRGLPKCQNLELEQWNLMTRAFDFTILPEWTDWVVVWICWNHLPVQCAK